MSTIRKFGYGWKCPCCGEGNSLPDDLRNCNCNEPLHISIPAGQHIHVTCPVHGDRKVYGPPGMW